jgi:hypothetical protein
MSQDQSLELLFEMNDEELFASLGRELQKKSLGAYTTPDKEKKKGKDWFNDQKNKLAEIICPNDSIKVFFESKAAERRLELATAIAEILSTSLIGLPILTISVLIVKNGLHELCEVN